MGHRVCGVVLCPSLIGEAGGIPPSSLSEKVSGNHFDSDERGHCTHRQQRDQDEELHDRRCGGRGSTENHPDERARNGDEAN